MGLFRRNPVEANHKKILKHMKKHGISQSDGLIVNSNGEVVYDVAQDGRDQRTRPSGTPPFMPEPGPQPEP